MDRIDLWRWMMAFFGLCILAYGLFAKTMRTRGAGWRGKVLKKRWQILCMRTFIVLLGIATINFAFTYSQ